MRNLLKRLNNQGSTLLTVIICLAFIGILGSMMLSVTMTNLQMKVIESKSKGNFYSCETAMEEMRVAVQEITAETIKDVYKNSVLTNYAYYAGESEGVSNKEIQNMVTRALLYKLSGFASSDLINTNEVITPDTNVLAAYTTSSSNLTVTKPTLYSEGATVISTVVDGETIETSSGAYVTIKGIKIEYVKDDYRTAIVSDIRVDIPEFTFTQGTQIVHYRMEQPFENYVLITDGGIISNNQTGTNNITGNVYAGDSGITVKSQLNGSHQVNMNGGNIVTRGNITVTNTAQLMIGETIKPIVWAKNLIINTEIVDSTTFPVLDIKGICIIKDDLTLEARNSDVTLSGAYIGYTGTHSAEGSAMMINGSGSSLVLDNLKSLILVGRAHVSVSDLILDKDSDILTGESIAFKSNQRAYLVPGKFIDNILHNPVTSADIAQESGAPTVSIIDDPIAEINYPSFVAEAPSNPFKIAAKQTGGTTLRYYYLNFRNGKLADDYLNLYASKYPNVLNTMASFSLGSVTLPTSGDVFCVGNLMSYSSGVVTLTNGLSNSGEYALDTDDTNLDEHMLILPLTGTAYVGSELAVIPDLKLGMLPGLYSKISHLLTLDTAKVYNEADQVVRSNIINGGIDYIIGDNSLVLSDPSITLTKYNGSASYTYSLTGPSQKSLILVGKDGGDAADVIIAAGSEFNGILVTKGNVFIGDNVKIRGLIISTGENTAESKITVGNGVQVDGRLVAAGNIIMGRDCTFEIKQAEATEDYIASIFESEGSILKYLFRNPVMTVSITETDTVANLVDLSNMITYENWKKIE